MGRGEQKGRNANFFKWFSWLLPARMRTKQSRLLPAAVPQQQLPAVAPAQQDVKHLVGVADATKPPRDVRRIVSLGRQAPVQGPDAYELVGELGTNQQQGSMKLMRHKRSQDLVAVKFVRRGAGVLLDKNVEREILNHRRLVHPNVLAFREVFATDDELAIMVEYASAGRLADKCAGQKLPEADARALFVQLLDGLAYCHGRGVFHRDLRPDMLLLSGSVFQPTLKIGGFGFSKSAALDSMAKTAVGMRGYMAPEVLLGRGPYDAALVDVWAAGVVLFLMLTGRLPFCHDDNHAEGVLDRAMMQRILKGQYYLPDDVALSIEAQDMLARAFNPDPAKRIPLAKLRRHPWLHGAPSVLNAAYGAESAAATPGDSAADEAAAPAQSEEGIQQVLQRARERRLRRISSSTGAAASHSNTQAAHAPAVVKEESMQKVADKPRSYTGARLIAAC